MRMREELFGDCCSCPGSARAAALGDVSLQREFTRTAIKLDWVAVYPTPGEGAGEPDMVLKKGTPISVHDTGGDWLTVRLAPGTPIYKNLVGRGYVSAGPVGEQTDVYSRRRNIFPAAAPAPAPFVITGEPSKVAREVASPSYQISRTSSGGAGGGALLAGAVTLGALVLLGKGRKGRRRRRKR